MKVSDNTAISMPMRNLLSILAAVGVGVWAYFGVIERLNNVETQNTLMHSDLEKAVEFSIRWPRGELGSLPADAEQFMLLEMVSGQVEKMEKRVDDMMHNAVNIKRLQEDMKEARENIEKLKDKIRANGDIKDIGGKY
jgi:succinate dehydrogenase/fumarate reductase flavoprotein subunit